MNIQLWLEYEPRTRKLNRRIINELENPSETGVERKCTKIMSRTVTVEANTPCSCPGEEVDDRQSNDDDDGGARTFSRSSNAHEVVGNKVVHHM